MRQGRSFGALNGISISIRPAVPKMFVALVGRELGPQVNVAVPWKNSSTADVRRSMPSFGSRSMWPSTRLGSSSKMNRDSGDRVAADVHQRAAADVVLVADVVAGRR